MLVCRTTNTQKRLQLGCHLRKGQRVGLRAWNDHDISVWYDTRSSHTEEFAQSSFHTISDHSLPEPTGHRNAQPGPATAGWRADHDKMGAVPALTSTLQREKISAGQQTSGFGQPVRPTAGSQPRASFGGIVTVRRLRPLARRLLMTARPAAVLMRTRKPCVRLRRRLLG